uniref:Uncharacterized protein n=1 Tax=Panagrolaimus sp. PS1159 TaxID=55785 RepID=A0AC35F552_9BILA
MASSRNLIVHFQRDQMVKTFNILTNELKLGTLIFDENSPYYFVQLQSMCNLKHVKAFLFNADDFHFSNFAEYYDFCLKCREFCEKHQIFYFFTFLPFITSANALKQTKTMVKQGEKVMLFLMDRSGIPAAGFTFIRKSNSYQMVSQWPSPPLIQQMEEYILGQLKPEKVIVLKRFGSKKLKESQKFFKNYNYTVITMAELMAHYMDPVVDKVLHLTGEKINPYNIEVPCLGVFEVNIDGECLIKSEQYDTAPFEKFIVVDVHPTKVVSLFASFRSSKPVELVKKVKLSEFKTKKAKVTLKLDINSFYDFKVEPFIAKEEEEAIANVGEKLNKVNIDADKKTIEEEAKKNDKENGERKPAINDPETVEIDKHVIPEKVQMIFDKQYFSVSYFANGKEYNAYDSDGEAKTPVYIAFTEKKPIVGKSAMEIYSEKPKFVVFDLIKLCSVSTADIFNPKWGFKLFKEEEKGESSFLTFETFECEKYSPVEFLLAIILKNGKDRIKKETGKKFEEIEIKFNGFSPNEILKKNFIEAGKLLKINIVFV